MSDKARERLYGMVRDGLNKNRSIAASIGFELATAAHFVSSGYSVWLKDIEGCGAPDIVVKKGDLLLEVECKHLSGEIGYPIHKSKFIEFIHQQIPVIEKYLDTRRQTIALLVSIPDRLHNANGYYGKLSQLVHKALSDQTSHRDDHGNEIKVKLLPVPRRIEQWNANSYARAVLKKIYGIENGNAIVIGKKGQPCVVIEMASGKEPKVLKYIFRQLKEAAKEQLSGEVPGTICVYLSAVSTSELKSFSGVASGRTGLEMAVSHFFHRRPHVSGLAFMSSDGPIWLRGAADRSLHVLRPENTALLFGNNDAPHPITEAMGLFPETPWVRIR